MTVWLPCQKYLFRSRLIISHQVERDHVTVGWNMLPTSLWDKLDKKWQDYYTADGWERFTTEGNYLFEGTAIATWDYKRGVHSYKDVPLLPGTYDVIYDLHRQVVTIDNGGLTLWGSEAIGDYDIRGIVGTVEVLHAPGFGTLFGTVEAKDDYGIAKHIAFRFYGPLPATTLMDGFTIYDSEGKYKTVSLPTGNYTVMIEVMGNWGTWGGVGLFGYRYKTFEVTIGQGWNEKNMAFEPPYDTERPW